MNTQLSQVKAMIDADKTTSAEEGRIKTKFREETKTGALELSKTYPGPVTELATVLGLKTFQLYDWRHQAGVVTNPEMSKRAKKSSKTRLASTKTAKSPNQSTIDRLTAQADRINKQLELVRLADKLGMQLDFD
jgi:transposase-like protein